MAKKETVAKKKAATANKKLTVAKNKAATASGKQGVSKKPQGTQKKQAMPAIDLSTVPGTMVSSLYSMITKE